MVWHWKPAIIGTIITKRSSAAFVRTIFFIVVVHCSSATLFNLFAMWPSAAFSCLRRKCVWRRDDFSINSAEMLFPKLILSWFARDVTKNQTKKLSILLSFYFHEVLQHLNTFMLTNFWFQRVLRFAIQDVWISRLLPNAAFSWRPGELLCELKTLWILGDFAI